MTSDVWSVYYGRYEREQKKRRRGSGGEVPREERDD
jgi:hypothetical protein